MPYSIKGLVNFVRGDKAFCKKKEAENSAYLKAVKLFYDNHFFDDNLYPNLKVIKK